MLAYYCLRTGRVGNVWYWGVGEGGREGGSGMEGSGWREGNAKGRQERKIER